MIKLDDKKLEESICLVVKTCNKDVIDNFRPVAMLLKKIESNGDGNEPIRQALELGKKVERSYNEYKNSVQKNIDEAKKVIEIHDFIEKKLQLDDIKEKQLSSNVASIDMGAFK